MLKYHRNDKLQKFYIEQQIYHHFAEYFLYLSGELRLGCLSIVIFLPLFRSLGLKPRSTVILGLSSSKESKLSDFYNGRTPLHFLFTSFPSLN